MIEEIRSQQAHLTARQQLDAYLSKETRLFDRLTVLGSLSQHAEPYPLS